MKTDTQVQQDVLAALEKAPSVHASEIGVAVKDGVVTLGGEVGSYAQKWDAEHVVQAVAGVQSLAVELVVKLTEFGTRSDADIARSARTALDAAMPPVYGAVQVMVEGGVITLSGDAESPCQLDAATDCVRDLPGVTGVSNEMGVRTRAALEPAD